MSTPRAERLRGRLSIDPDAPPVQAVPEPAPPVQEALATAEEEQPPPARTTSKRRRPTAPARVLATEDPSIRPGEKDYRSFYVDDLTFARWRAAIHWCSRHPDASDEVAENMSVAVERWMAEMAADLEKRFNGGEVFRMPPGTRKRRRKAEG